MRAMHQSSGIETLGPLRAVMLGVLCQVGDFGAPEQSPGDIDVGSDRAVQGSAWPGQHFGVRAPFPGETPISWEQVHHAVRQGVL